MHIYIERKAVRLCENHPKGVMLSHHKKHGLMLPLLYQLNHSYENQT
jgi:hypothetical protein